MGITGCTDLGNGKFAVTVDYDPRQTPTDLPAGSLIITHDGRAYIKLDEGSTTNIEPFADQGSAQLLLNANSTGILKGGLLSVNESDPTKWDMTEMWGVIIDNYSDSLNPIKTFVHVPQKVGETDPYLTTGDRTYVGVDKDGNFVFYPDSPPDPPERRDQILIGRLDHPGRVQIVAAKTEPFYAADTQAQINDFFEIFGPFGRRGNHYLRGSTGLYLSKTGGVVFSSNSAYHLTRKSPHLITREDEEDISFTYYYRISPGTWKNDNQSVKIVDPDHWDTGNGLELVPPGKFTIQYLTYSPGENVNSIQYGQALYNSMAEARSHLNDEIEINPYNHKSIPRGWLIIQQGTTTLSNPDQALFVTVAEPNMVVGHGGGGEVNTGSNQGTGGVGPFLGKSGVDLQFRNIIGAHPRITVTENPSTKNIQIDAVVGTPSPAAVVIGNTSMEGSAESLARSDHVHQVLSGPPHDNAVVIGNTGMAGIATTFARSDHIHKVVGGLPAIGAVVIGNTPSEGSASTFSRSDHIHQVSGAAPTDGSVVIGNNSLEGVAGTFARSDHIHKVVSGVPAPSAVVIGNTAMDGSATTFSRSDHIHQVLGGPPAPLAVAAGNTGMEGTAGTFSRSDHIHGVPVEIPLSVGAFNAIGSANTFVRSDHVHAGLRREGGDFASFPEKGGVSNQDWLLVEDSLDSNNKKKVSITNLVGGADTQIQFNDGGVFGGGSGLTWNKTTQVLSVGVGKFQVNGATGGSDSTVTIRGVHNQSGNLIDFKDSQGTTLSRITPSGVIESLLPTGTAPFLISSTTLNTNLNADLLDGYHAHAFRLRNGFVTATSSTLEMVGSNFQITTTSSYEIYSRGVKYTKTTTQSVPITNDNTLHYVYFDTSGELQVSTAMWDLLDDNVQVATVYRYGTGVAYAIGDERHLFDRNRDWHNWAHKTLGPRWESGYAGTFGNNSMSLTRGVIYDEDRPHDSGTTQTLCRLWYRNPGGGSMAFESNVSVPYKANAGVLQYDNAGTLTDVPTNGYVCSYLYGTNDPYYPVYVVVGQNQYPDLPTARTDPPPILPGLTTAEWKLLYRLIYRNVSGVPTYIENSDYRSVSTGLAISPSISGSHPALRDRGGINQHPATAISTNASEFVGNLTSGEIDVQLALGKFDKYISPILLLASNLDSPNNTNWKVNALAPLAGDSLNPAWLVRLFDDTAEEGVGFTLELPSWSAAITLTLVSRALVAPSTPKTVTPKLYTRSIPPNGPVSAWSSGITLTPVNIPATNPYYQYSSREVLLSTLGLSPGRIAQFELTRVATGNNLAGDWVLLAIGVKFS